LREIWERKRPLAGWNTKLTWIKSGSKSKVYDTPYEIYQKRHGPTLLSDPAVNADIALSLTSEIGHRTRHVPGDSTVEVTLTIAVGRNLDSSNKARKAYRTRNKVATFHSKRYELRDLADLTNNLMDILDRAAQLPSKPSWLAISQVTIRFGEGEEHLIRKPQNARHRVEVKGELVTVG